MCFVEPENVCFHYLKTTNRYIRLLLLVSLQGRQVALKLDIDRMKFSTTDLPPDVGSTIAIVEVGDGKPGMFSHLFHEKYVYYRTITQESEDDADRWCIMNKILTPLLPLSYHLYGIFFFRLHGTTRTLTTHAHSRHAWTHICKSYPVFASSKTKAANPQDWQSHNWRLAIDRNVAYHWKHNAVKS